MLAWPAFSLLKTQYPAMEITALVPEYTATMAKLCPWIDNIIIDEKHDSFIKDIVRLSKKIKSNNYDISISLYSEARTSISLWLAKINTRIGPATKLAQIFLNKRLKQKRSQSIRPEYEYNIEIIKYFIKSNGDTPIEKIKPPFLSFDQSEILGLKNTLIKNYAISDDAKIIIIHPGTGGSATNLTLDRYAELALNIEKNNNVYFIITAGPGELPIAKSLSHLIKQIHHHIHYSTSGIVEFCKFINLSDLFISGSTGPLHIAGALNICTAAFYPEKKSATALRWQTLNTDKKRVAFTLNNSTNDDSTDIDIKLISQIIANKFIN